MIHYYRIPGGQSEERILQLTKGVVPSIVSVKTESCFNVEVVRSDGLLPPDDQMKLMWLFTETFEPQNTSDKSFFQSTAMEVDNVIVSAVIEVGPRLAFSTAWSSNCSSMCHSCGITSVGRIERSRRYLISTSGPNTPLTSETISKFAALVHDRMTECVYVEPLSSFANGSTAQPVTNIPVLTGLYLYHYYLITILKLTWIWYKLLHLNTTHYFRGEGGA